MHYVEGFWREIGNILPKSFSDQGRLNYGLKALGIEWHSLNNGSFEGVCANGLRVNTLSYSLVCRSNCTRKNLTDYYVWHKPASRDGQSKKKAATQNGVWLLSPHWDLDCENVVIKREVWLKCIHA